MSQPPQLPPPSGTGRRPTPAAVGCGLFLLVLVLALVGFFGMRAWMGDGERGEQSSAPPSGVPASGETVAEGGHVMLADALPLGELLVVGRRIAAV